MSNEQIKAKVRNILSSSVGMIGRDTALKLLNALEAAEGERDEMNSALKSSSDNAVTWMKRALKAEMEIARRDAAAGRPLDCIVSDGFGQSIGGVPVSDRINCKWPVGTIFYAATPPAVLPPGDYSELLRLREDVKGPDGFDTWKDAAIAERVARVALERGAVNSNHEIDYLTAMSAFHSDQWHKMSPITGYMHGYNRASSQITPPAVLPPEKVINASTEGGVLCRYQGYNEALRDVLALGAQPHKPVLLPALFNLKMAGDVKTRHYFKGSNDTIKQIAGLLDAANVPYEVKK